MKIYTVNWVWAGSEIEFVGEACVFALNRVFIVVQGVYSVQMPLLFYGLNFMAVRLCWSGEEERKKGEDSCQLSLLFKSLNGRSMPSLSQVFLFLRSC